MMDLLLEAWVSALVELTRLKWMLGGGRFWKPGEKLKLLFAGYNGTRNVGSDVRVEEMLRQVRQVLGEANLALSVMTYNPEFTHGYFGTAQQVQLPMLFPPFLGREVPKFDGVIACEGSMFKSKFANALTTMMIGALGIAAAENKLSIGYGGEAGEMDPLLKRMCRRYCGQSLVITRNVESQAILSELGVPTELGTDTAWTFEPPESGYGRRALFDAGWDGTTPVLVVCPINPYIWPVKASVMKLVARGLFGAYTESHYRSVYFHTSGPRVKAAYERYLGALVGFLKRFRQEHAVFPVLAATERLDQDACRRIAERIGGAPVFTSDECDMYQLVSILRSADLMVSSRYHGIVTSMPALVASAGVTMDERIRNLMRERGHEHLLLTVDDPDLEEKLGEAMDALWREREAIREGIGRTVVKNLKVMAGMGVYLQQEVARRYPEFPVRSGVHSWEEYLPPLSANLNRLVERFDSATEPMRHRAEA